MGAETLEAEARERYRAGDYVASIALHERAFAAHRASGDPLAAARAGRALAWLHGNLHGDWAVAGGWRGRTVRLLDGASGDAARGWALLLRTYDDPSLDVAAQVEGYARASELGRAAGDVDLEVDGLVGVGLVRVLAGRCDDGMRALDEAMASVCAGEVGDLYVVEGAFCALFQCCELVHDVARAEQWVRAASTTERHGAIAAAGFCRAHYGGILTEAGRWTEAEVELLASADVFSSGYTAMRGIALARLAALRVRQGRLEDAAALLVDAGDVPDAVRPLAELHLASGQAAVARDVLERAVPDGDALTPAAAPLLCLLVEVLLALDDRRAATAAGARLAALAATQARRSSPTGAYAALAAARLTTGGGGGDPRPAFDVAISGFGRARLPLEQARARLALAEAVAGTTPQVARTEATRALRDCERHGAAHDVDRAAALLRSIGAPVPRGRRGDGVALTKREEEVLLLLGRGLSNPEIATRLVISRKTVEHHVGHVLAKLGVRNRAEAAAAAARRASAAT